LLFAPALAFAFFCAGCFALPLLRAEEAVAGVLAGVASAERMEPDAVAVVGWSSSS